MHSAELLYLSYIHILEFSTRCVYTFIPVHAYISSTTFYTVYRKVMHIENLCSMPVHF